MNLTDTQRVMLHAMADELTKISGVMGRVSQLANPMSSIGEHGWDLAGLGVLAVPGLDTLQAAARAKLQGDTSPGAVEHRQLLSEPAHAAADVGGLGILAIPPAIHAAKFLRGGH